MPESRDILAKVPPNNLNKESHTCHTQTPSCWRMDNCTMLIFTMAEEEKQVPIFFRIVYSFFHWKSFLLRSHIAFPTCLSMSTAALALVALGFTARKSVQSWSMCRVGSS